MSWTRTEALVSTVMKEHHVFDSKAMRWVRRRKEPAGHRHGNSRERP